MKLSIITINYNNANGLKKTMESVINQSFKDYEFIIIDGGSTDGSAKVIQSITSMPAGIYADDQFPIKYWISEPDSGIYNAMNKGTRIAKGEYCLYLNSGDYLYEDDSLKKIFDYQPIEDIIYTNQNRIGGKGQYTKTFPEKLTFYWLFTEFLPHNCTLFKRSLFDKIGFYSENYKIVSDWLFYLIALVKYESSYRYYPEIISVMVDGGISNHPDYHEKVKDERTECLKRFFPLFNEDYEALYYFRYNTPFKKIKRHIKKSISKIT